jgi:hypothetical protein
LKCPYCGYEDEGLGTTCDNCWREIRNPPGTYRTCRSCKENIRVEDRFCPVCGADNSVDVGAADRVLAREDFGPLWTGSPSDISYKFYEDKVVVEQNFHITGTKRVTTTSRSMFMASNKAVLVIFAGLGIYFLAISSAASPGLMMLLVPAGLFFLCFSLYSFLVFIRMNAKTSGRREER